MLYSFWKHYWYSKKYAKQNVHLNEPKLKNFSEGLFLRIISLITVNLQRNSHENLFCTSSNETIFPTKSKFSAIFFRPMFPFTDTNVSHDGRGRKVTHLILLWTFRHLCAMHLKLILHIFNRIASNQQAAPR